MNHLQPVPLQAVPGPCGKCVLISGIIKKLDGAGLGAFNRAALYIADMPERTDGTKVLQKDAITAWANVARPYLIEVARARTTVTYKALSNYVRQETRIDTRQLIYQWIGEVLGEVSNDAEKRGEPHLVSLCVNIEGSVGAGYLWAPPDFTQQERDDLAKLHRTDCYTLYSTRMDSTRAPATDALIPPTEDDLEGVDEGASRSANT